MSVKLTALERDRSARSSDQPADMTASIRGFCEETRGGVTLYFLVMMILLLGLLGLVIDSSRTFVAHSNAQNYIDIVAVAAANELDGRPDAIIRANKVINSSMLTKSTTIGMAEDDEFKIGQVYFLTDAPNSPDGTLRPEHFQSKITTDPAAATHVLLATESRSVPFGLLHLVFKSENGGGKFDFRTWAAATLVRRSTPPLLAAVIPAADDPFQWPAGTALRLEKNRDGSWAPGQYGVNLGIPDDPNNTCAAHVNDSEDYLECLLAIDDPQDTFGNAVVSFTGDNTTSITIQDSDGNDVTVKQDSLNVHAALNSRFGIIDPQAASWINETSVSIDTNQITSRPMDCAGNIIYTAEGSTKNKEGQGEDYQGLPKAQCFNDGTCGYLSNGAVTLEELNTYFNFAHDTDLPATDHDGNPFKTRYDVYNYERHMGLLEPEQDGNQGSRATCHATNSASDTKANRRVIRIALVSESEITNTSSLQQTDMPIVAYVDAFLSDYVEHRPTFIATFDDPVPDGNGGFIYPRAGDIPNTYQDEVQQGSDYRTFDPYKDQGMRVYAIANERIKNNGSREGFHFPILFDTSNYSGGDNDLADETHNIGNVIVIPEKGDTRPTNDRHKTGPDDHAQGGILIFTWDYQTVVNSIRFFDGEESDNKVYLYRDQLEWSDIETHTDPEAFLELHTPDATIDIPKIGDHEHLTLSISSDKAYTDAVADADNAIDAKGIQTMIIELTGSGAVDEINFSNQAASQNKHDNMEVEVVDVIRPYDDPDRREASWPHLTN
ncbi:MAG: pilus assembly protein TadG-related protein [Pikeienuella sp.]